MKSLTIRCHHRYSGYLLPIALIALAALFAATPRIAAAEEVECNSVRIEMAPDGYDLTCDDDKGLDHSYQTLEANSTDGTHFLVIGDMTTNNGYIFNGQGLRKNLTDFFSSLDFKDWHSGKGEQGLTTAEFVSDYKTVASACVGFQKYTHKSQWGGWKRHIIGFGCSRVGDRSQVYEALKKVDFPN
jgi:hypothetical protein